MITGIDPIYSIEELLNPKVLHMCFNLQTPEFPQSYLQCEIETGQQLALFHKPYSMSERELHSHVNRSE